MSEWRTVSKVNKRALGYKVIFILEEQGFLKLWRLTTRVPGTFIKNTTTFGEAQTHHYGEESFVRALIEDELKDVIGQIKRGLPARRLDPQVERERKLGRSRV